MREGWRADAGRTFLGGVFCGGLKGGGREEGGNERDFKNEEEVSSHHAASLNQCERLSNV